MNNSISPELSRPSDHRTPSWLAGIAVFTVIWFAAYTHLTGFADYILSLTPWDRSSHTGEAIHFFFYDTPKVLLLLIGIVFLMGIVQTFFAPEKTRALLAGRRLGVGNTMAALLGIVTPFCSCSAVPLFIGFLSAGVPLGITFSFLVAAPMVNEIALALLFGMFGWKVAGLYLLLGLGIAFNIDVIVPAIERLLHANFLPKDIYLISKMPSDPQYSDIMPIAVISLVLAFVATIYPSWRASRVNPAEALRYE